MYPKKITGKSEKGQKYQDNIHAHYTQTQTHMYTRKKSTKMCSGNVGSTKVLRIMKKPTKTSAIHNKHKTCC